MYFLILPKLRIEKISTEEVSLFDVFFFTFRSYHYNCNWPVKLWTSYVRTAFATLNSSRDMYIAVRLFSFRMRKLPFAYYINSTSPKQRITVLRMSKCHWVRYLAITQNKVSKNYLANKTCIASVFIVGSNLQHNRAEIFCCAKKHRYLRQMSN